MQDDRLPAAEATLAWRTGIARVASNPKQRTALDAAAATQPAVAALTTAALQTAVPGAVPGESTTEAATAALLLRDAVVLHPHRYMRCVMWGGGLLKEEVFFCPTGRCGLRACNWQQPGVWTCRWCAPVCHRWHRCARRRGMPSWWQLVQQWRRFQNLVRIVMWLLFTSTSYFSNFVGFLHTTSSSSQRMCCPWSCARA